MRPTLFLSLLFLITALSGYAQTNSASRLGASLKLFLSESIKDSRFLIRKNGVDYVPVFLEFEPGAAGISLAKTGIEIRTRIKTIATADVPLTQLRMLSENPAIKKIELPLLLRKTDTIVNKLVTANRVLAGDAPLSRAYTGANTLIGIIDDGIDITHPDFLDNTGKTRIVAIWNMDYAMDSVTTPSGFLYGREWNSAAIDSFHLMFKKKEIINHEMRRIFGSGLHGTPVSGLAAGNQGIAPGASIAAVALTAFGDTILRSDRVIDAIAFLYAKAKALQKKCVINISLGLQEGAPHDGKSLVERAIDAFCEEKPDILVTVSAGNNGNSWKHWAATPIHKDSSFGFFRCAYGGSIYFTFPKRYSNSISISLTDSRLVSLNSPAIHPDSILYQTPFVRISDLLSMTSPQVFRSFLKNGNSSSTIQFSAAHANSDYDELVIRVEEHTSSPNGIIFDDHLYRFIFKGAGEIHGWYPFLNLHPVYFFGNSPYPEDSTYITTDNAYTTIIPSHAYTVLSAGAFNARECYISNIHNEAVGFFTPCQVSYFTSHGPTLDGRIKPDILAPGENVITSRNRMDEFLGHQFIIDSSTQAFGGTSAASPITAGIAALLWEFNPEFARDEIIERIKSTAHHDNFTGTVPNNISGWGKVDVFKAMTGETTNIDAICNTHISCDIKLPEPDPPQQELFYVKFFPNPANGTMFINYRSVEDIALHLYTSTGQLLTQLKFPGNNLGIIKSVSLKGLPSGVYFVRVTGKEKSVTKKILVVN